MSTTLAFDRWRSKWIVASIEVIIFRAINQRKRYGGELVTLCRTIFGDFVKVSTVYGILNRAEELELIRKVGMEEEEGITRGTSRKYYGLTKSGVDFLELMIDQISEVTNYLLGGWQELKEVME